MVTVAPSSLSELVLLTEQVKRNLVNHAGNREVLDYVGPTFLEIVARYKGFEQGALGQEYTRWYIDFRNGRVT